jgi:hypothetical protein
MSKHPLATILGDGVIAGLTTWALWKWVAKPLGKGISHLGYRWRRFLAPIWRAIEIEILAVLWHWLAPWYWPIALVLPVLGGTAAVLGPRLSAGWSRLVLTLVPDTFDSGRKGVLDRVPERVYAVSVLTYLGLWLALRVGAGPSTITTYGWWVGLVGFGGTWWWHRRVRTAGLADRYSRRWRILASPDLGKIKSLHGSRVVKQQAHGRNLAILTIRLAAAHTVADISGDLDRLCSFFSLRRGAITLAEDEDNARRCTVSILRGDPWKGDLPHELREAGSYSLASLKSRLPIGTLATAATLEFKAKHLQVVGKNGSGKSVMLENLMIWWSGATDVQMVAGDMASGATLSMWAPCFLLPVATNFEGVLSLLERVVAEIERREALLGELKAEDPEAGDSLTPSPETPALYCVIDELPKFIGEAAGQGAKGKRAIHLLNVVGQMGRKVIVWVITAAQNGSKANMGAKELQAQMSTISFYLSEHASRVLWGVDHRQGWSSSGLKVGQFLLNDDDHTEPEVAKSPITSVKQRRAHIAAVAKLDKMLHPQGCDALFDEPPVREDAPFISEAPIDRDDATEQAILAHLSEQDAHWSELAKAASVSRPTVFRYLKAMANQGKIHKVGRAKDVKWRIGQDPEMGEHAA